MREPDRCSMMEKMEKELIEYLDGRAKPAERRAVEEHMAGCAACRVRAEEFRALWSALDDLPTICVSPAFDASLRARLAAEPARRGFWGWLPSPRLAFATMALVALSAWISFLPQGGRNLPPTNQPVTNDADFRMIRDLPVLENYEVVSEFDALSELPVSEGAASATDEREESR